MATILQADMGAFYAGEEQPSLFDDRARRRQVLNQAIGAVTRGALTSAPERGKKRAPLKEEA